MTRIRCPLINLEKKHLGGISSTYQVEIGASHRSLHHCGMFCLLGLPMMGDMLIRR